MRIKVFLKILIVLIIVFLAIGCSVPLSIDTTTAIDAGTVEAISPTTHFLTSTPHITAKPILPLLTEVSSVTTNATHTPSDTPFPNNTLTPLPTLLPDAAQNLTLELMMTNGDCELPCWWGLSQGETSWSYAFHFLQTFTIFEYERITDEKKANYSLSYQLPEQDDSYSRLGFEVIDGVITGIVVGERGMEIKYQIDNLLDTLGLPEKIFFQHFWLGEIGELELHLILFFPSKGVLAYYHVPTEITEEIYQSCFKGVGPELTLWAPSDDIDRVEDILGEQYLTEFLEIVESGMTNESFYKTFLDLENHPCLEVLAP